MGRLVVLEGLDGSGKATQAALLSAALAARGLPVRQVSFPDYASNASWPVRMYLAGEFGSEPGQVNAFAASAFYAVDRYASFKKDWQGFYEGGGLVIADRYVTSNAVHQCAKLPRDQWAGYLDWLFDLEYEKMGLPRPDAVFYLAVDPAVSQQLLARRYGGQPQRRDIHERDLAYLASSRQAAEYCAEQLGWQRVDCCCGAAIRPKGEIAARLLQALLPVLAAEGEG